MKIIVPLVFAICAGCAANEAPTTSTQTSALTGDTTQSENWVAGKGTVEDLWPTDGSVTTAHVLYRKGHDRYDENGNFVHTFIAVVVWNTNQVPHVYWVNRGNDGSDFKSTWDQAFNAAVNRYYNSNGTLPDPDGGSDGSPTAGTPPKPNVDNMNGYFPVGGSFVTDAKNAASAIHEVTYPGSPFVGDSVSN